MKNEMAASFGADIVALARTVCAAPVGLLNVISIGWTGAEGIDPADLERIVSLARNATGQSGFFEASWGPKYCAGVTLGNALGVLCVLDDRPRAPLTDAQRDLLRALGNQVVERHELQRALTALRPLGHLTRGIAHDMNNALQTIVGALNTVGKLIETNNLERTPRFLAAALRSAHRAGELTGNLQRLARRESGGSKVVELKPLLDSLEDLFRRICGERITLQIHLADATATVVCNPGELEESLLTLVIEATEAISDTGNILITTRRNEHSVWVCVAERCMCLPIPTPGG